MTCLAQDTEAGPGRLRRKSKWRSRRDAHGHRCAPPTDPGLSWAASPVARPAPPTAQTNHGPTQGRRRGRRGVRGEGRGERINTGGEGPRDTGHRDQPVASADHRPRRHGRQGLARRGSTLSTPTCTRPALSSTSHPHLLPLSGQLSPVKVLRLTLPSDLTPPPDPQGSPTVSSASKAPISPAARPRGLRSPSLEPELMHGHGLPALTPLPPPSLPTIRVSGPPPPHTPGPGGVSLAPEQHGPARSPPGPRGPFLQPLDVLGGGQGTPRAHTQEDGGPEKAGPTAGSPVPPAPSPSPALLLQPGHQLGGLHPSADTRTRQRLRRG